MRLKLTILITCVLCPFFQLLSAQEIARERRDTVTFYFNCASSMFDSGASSDKEIYDELVDFILSIDKEHNDTIRVTLRGSASPEGNAAKNLALSSRRVDALHHKLLKDLSQRNIKYTTDYIGDNWDELKILIATSDIADKDAILDLLSLPLETKKAGKVVSTRKRSMMNYKGGSTWRELNKRFFPQLRKTEVVVEYVIVERVEPPTVVEPQPEPQPEPEIEEAVTEETFSEETQPVEIAVTEEKRHREFLFALKTNLLYDAIAIPNIGIEFPLPSNFSVGGDWMYAWWKTDTHHRYWRTYGGDLFVRKWFGVGSTSLTGHHVGIYGSIVTYDFEWGGRGYLGDRWSYGGGLEYGYSLKIANRLNLDFTLGIGYLGGEYKEYIPDAGCYVWQVTKQRHWFGPTKAEISLVWLIGNGYKTTKKGGAK